MTTEQETGRGAPARRAVPKTSTRRSGTSHQSKPRPRPDTRPEADVKRSAAERARAEAAGRGPAGVRPAETGTAPATERPDKPAQRPAGVRARPKTRASRPAQGRRPAGRQRAPFVLLVVGLLCGGLVSLLLLNTMLAQDAIIDANLREEIRVARLENDRIEQEYQRKTQPNVIAELAEKQGQRPDWGDVNRLSSAGDSATQVDTER